jgi:hypothetical protein
MCPVVSRAQRTALQIATVILALALCGAVVWLTRSWVPLAVTGALAVLAALARLLTVRVARARAVPPAQQQHRRPGRPYLVPRELPPPPVFFTGRDEPYAQALALLRGKHGRRRGPFTLVVTGEAGVGKSGFAIKLATELLSELLTADPESGAIYASLTDAAMTDSGPNGRLHNVMRDLVDSLQGPDEEIPETYERRQAEFRRLGQGPRGEHVLYLFDDVADERVIAEVMPTRGDAIVLVTSRSALPRLNAQQVTLHPLTIDDGRSLLLVLLGEPTLDQAGEISLTKIAASAAGYPFALHLAARAIRSHGVWALPEAAAGLREPDPAAGAESARHRMLDLSVGMLDQSQRETLLYLAVMPDPTFVPWMVTVVAGLSPDPDEDGVGDKEARNICERLADRRLLERFATDATGVVRLRMPDGVRDYLRARDGADPDPHDPVSRVRRLDLAAARARLESAQRERHKRDLPAILGVMIPEALIDGRMSAALNEARAALSEARERAQNIDGRSVPGDEERRALAMLAIVLTELGGLDDALEICQLDRRARVENGQPEAGPRDVVDARLRRCLGRLRRREWRLDAAITELALAREIAAESKNRTEEIWCLRELGIAESMRIARPGHIAAAHAYIAEATRLLPGLRRTEFLAVRLMEATSMIRINSYKQEEGGVGELLLAIDELLEAAERIPPSSVTQLAWLNYHLARAKFELALSDRPGSPEDRRLLVTSAHQAAQKAMVDFSGRSHRYGAARCRLEIGSMYLRDHKLPEALPLLEEARETFYFSGDRWIEARTAIALARLRIEARQNLVEAAADLEFAAVVFQQARDDASLSETRQAQAQLLTLEAAAEALAVTR